MLIRGLFVLVIAALSYGEASAEWVRVGGTHKYDGYVEMTTIGRTEQMVTLWTLRDFTVTRQVARGPYRSMKTKKQYDCRNNRSRLLFAKYYAEQMGKGRLVYQGKGTKQWAKVAPGSDGEAEWKVACRNV
ncbi:MAG: hypothetical protein RL768_1383 [Nitrospirota bacterium]|jgi:hypothetical protein|nr:hypothetical protein [Nitrospira sp.]